MIYGLLFKDSNNTSLIFFTGCIIKLDKIFLGISSKLYLFWYGIIIFFIFPLWAANNFSFNPSGPRNHI